MTDISFGTIWDRTTAFASEHGGTLFFIGALLIALPHAAWVSIGPIGKGAAPGVSLLVSLAVLALTLVAFYGSVAVVALTLDPASGRAGALHRAGSRFLPAFALWLLALLAVVLLAVPIVIALKAAGWDLRTISSGSAPASIVPGAAFAFAILYGLALLVVLLWAYARLVLLTPVIVAERIGFGAFARSVRLTRGLTWKIIGMLLLYVVVAGIAQMAAQFVFGAIFRVILPSEGAVSAASVLSAVATATVSTVFGVLAAIFTTLLYRQVVDATPR